MNKVVSKLVIALLLGMFVATSGVSSALVLAEQANTQQDHQQVPSAESGNNQSNEHSGHH